MEGWIFHGCTALEAVTLPDGLTSMGQQVFANCSALKRAVLPESLTEIGIRTFYQCTALTSVVLPANLKSIPDYTFYHCEALGELTLPAGITSIGASAFDGCTGLENVWIPDSVTSVGKNAFASCTGLTSITLPAQITAIPEGAFWGCTALASVRLEGNVTSIGSRAFDTRSALKQIELPDSLTTIENYAFHQSGLERITIPSEVTAIPDGAFSECSALRGVLFQGEITEQISGFSNISDLLIFYYMADEPDGESDIFKAYRGAKAVAYTNGGYFTADTVFESNILAKPIRDGYQFGGWYTDKECNTPAAATDGKVEIQKRESGNLYHNYYAKWVESEPEAAYSIAENQKTLAEQIYGYSAPPSAMIAVTGPEEGAKLLGAQSSSDVFTVTPEGGERISDGHRHGGQRAGGRGA